MILLNDSPERFSWMVLMSRHQGVDGLWDDFSIIIVLSSRKEVMVCLDLFCCQNSVFVTEKSMTTWKQSFMKKISNYFCVISQNEFCICCRSCWKVDKFFTFDQERRSIDAWIVVNFFQPDTTDNFPYPRNCQEFFWINVFFYNYTFFFLHHCNDKSKTLLFFVSPFLLRQSLTYLILLAEKFTRFYFQGLLWNRHRVMV